MAVTVVESGEALQLIRSQGLIADTFIARLSEEVERARQLVDALQDRTVDDDAVSDADGGSNGDADPEPEEPADLVAEDATSPIDWSPPDEPPADDTWRPTESGGDQIDHAASYDDDYFDRVASDFVAEVGSSHQSGPEPEHTIPVPASSLMALAPLGAPGLDSRDHRGGTAIATLPVTVLAPFASLKASFQELEEGLVGSSMRLEVCQCEPGMPEGSRTLRLVAYDPAGWWEYGDVSVTSDGPSAPSAVVTVAELRRRAPGPRPLRRWCAGADPLRR